MKRIWTSLAMATIPAFCLGTITACGVQRYPGVRIASPNDRYEARFLGIGGGGAAGSIHAIVEIAEMENGSTQEVLSARNMFEVCLEWKSDRELVVAYPDSAVVESTNPGVAIGSKKIAVVLVPVESREGLLINRSCAGALGALGKPGDDEPVHREAMR